MKKKYCMVIDSSVCIDCKACMVSCKVQHKVPRGFWRNWIKNSDPDFTLGKYTSMHFQPGGCMQCDNPTCVYACPSGATFKDDETGIIHVNEDLCIGCGNCVKACPYHARYRHPVKRVPDKCDFCRERLDMGLLPACVDTCPTKARNFGDRNDPDSDVSRLLREQETVRIVSRPVDTEPNMFYLSSTMPMDWPGPVEYPAAHQAMVGVVNPLVKVAVGLSGLGVAAMFLKQLFTSDEASHEEKKEEV